MFERFTDGARQVVVLAQDEARNLRHDYIGTEHILLGLLRQEGAGGRALEPFEVTAEEVRAQVARLIGLGDEVATGQIPFTPRAKKVLELSLREALHKGDDYIGPEHILLGMLREGEGVGARILMDFADLEEIRCVALRTGEGPDEGSGFRLDSPPLAPEVIEELDRVRGEKEKALEEQEFERAAKFRDREFRLSSAAYALQRTWADEARPQAAEGTYRRASRVSATPRGAASYGPLTRLSLMLLGWLLFGVALGVGVLVGWAIWG